MPNRFRGEATLLAGAETFTLVADVNAFILAEDATELDLNALLKEIDRRPSSLKLARSVLWALLQQRHAPLNMLRAGEIIGDAGLIEARAAITSAIAAAFPKPKEGDAADADADPRPAAGGTGNDSTVVGAP